MVSGSNLDFLGKYDGCIEKCPPITSDHDISFSGNAVKDFTEPISCRNLSIIDCDGAKLPGKFTVNNLYVKGMENITIPDGAEIKGKAEMLESVEINGKLILQSQEIDMQEQEEYDPSDDWEGNWEEL